MEFSSSNIKRFLIFWETETAPTHPPPQKNPYISGNGTFLCFMKWKP